MTKNPTTLPTNASTLALAVPDEVITALDNWGKIGVESQTIQGLRRAFVQGAVCYNMTQLLTPQVMENIMWLQNSQIGFLTDQPQGYNVDVVRFCVIQAASMGLNVIGNEFNILASRMYVTKNGMKRLLRNISGLRYHCTAGIPKFTETGAVVQMVIDWTYAGEKNEKTLEFAIRVNKGMGADAVIGKATRKALAWLYEEVTGNAADEGEAGDIINVPAENPLATAEKPAKKDDFELM